MLTSAATAQQDATAPTLETPDSIYSAFSAAYTAENAAAVSGLYSEDAVTAEFESGRPPKPVIGAAAVQSSFERLFRAYASGDRSVAISFRITHRSVGPAQVIDGGYYRFRITEPGRAPRESYGAYVLTMARRASGWRISSDISTTASLDDFERAEGGLVGSTDETLSPAFYDRLLGEYRASDGCRYFVTRSSRRLFLDDRCAGTLRGLDRVSGERWRAGGAVVPAAPYTLDVSFRRSKGSDAYSLELSGDGQLGAREAQQIASQAIEQVEVVAEGGVRLSGALKRPAGLGPHPAVVMILGSGAQDRHGYASIADLIANRFLKGGFAVLQLDKRGVGASGGAGGAPAFRPWRKTRSLLDASSNRARTSHLEK